jgi:hypothetical protein
MRFRQFKPTLNEALSTSVSADHLEGLKDLIANKIKLLPDDEATQKALKEIEDLLDHVNAGGRIGRVGNEIDQIQDSAVRDARKILSRLVLSLAEEVGATPEQRAEFFELWKADQIVNIAGLLSNKKMTFDTTFTGYGKNPLITEFVNEVMNIAELGMGKGEFGLNVLSKSVEIPKQSKSADGEEGGGGAKKGDLVMTLDNVKYQVECKTESGGAARFGDQEVRPAEGFEAAAVALNNYVKENKLYKRNMFGWKLSGSGMNLNQAIDFYHSVTPAEQSKFMGLARTCLTLIFGDIKGGRPAHRARLKKNVNEILSAIEAGDNGGAAQAYSQASFNFYMSRKHDDGVLYTNLNDKTFVFYDDAAQLLAQGLRFHASTPYISATKDPVRSVYPQISVQATTFGADAASKGLKKIYKKPKATSEDEHLQKVYSWAAAFAQRRNVTNQRVVQGMANATADLIAKGVPTPEIMTQLEVLFPQLKPKVLQTQPTPKPAVAAPATAPAAPAPAPAAQMPATMKATA